RGCVPLERVGEPRVVTYPPALLQNLCPPDIDHEYEHADRHDPGSDRRGEVVGLPEPTVMVRPDPSRHPEQAEHVLGEEGEVEADEGEPEVPFAEPFVQQAAEHILPALVEAAEDPEHRPAEQHVMEMG